MILSSGTPIYHPIQITANPSRVQYVVVFNATSRLEKYKAEQRFKILKFGNFESTPQERK